MMKKENLSVYSSLINGKTELPQDPTGEWLIRSPARSENDYAKCVYSYAQIDQVVKAASLGGVQWRTRTQNDRASLIQQAYQKLSSAKDEWMKVASAELGRSSNDLNLEIKQFDRWFESFQKLGELKSEARGTTAFVGSYVWPLFHTLQFTFLNLLAGNSMVIKPSEKATLSVLKLAEIITEVPALSTAVQVLVGEKEMGRRLVCHDQIQTVMFMGSFEVGMRVKQDTLSQPAKEVLLYLGAKNIAVLCEDVKTEETMDALIQDAFLSTGQNCRSGSVFFVHHSQYQKFCDEFHERAKRYKIGPPESEPFAGPLVESSMMERYMKFSGISEREGAEVLMRGKPLPQPEKGYYITPTIAVFDQITADQMKKSVSLQTEILSPHISIIQFKTYEELIEITSPMQHGLTASIWGHNPELMNKIAGQLQFGQILFNQSLLEWNPAESFQARKKSGNHAYYGLKLIEQLTTLKSIT